MRILFINRMLSMERGGGETFDLEIARHLQQLGCDISFLSGVPLFSKARISNPYSGFPASPGSYAEASRFPAFAEATAGKQVSSFTLRSPYFGWFPWDKVKGGWRLRLADFWMFERRAAAWLAKHERDYDVIQVCELPYLVARAKGQGMRVPIVMRLTAPNFYDRWGGLQAADAVVASGETVNQVRETLRPDCHDIPNSVDTDMFRPQESDFRNAHAIPASAFLILYVARFQDFKNHALLLDAFARFLTVHCLCHTQDRGAAVPPNAVFDSNEDREGRRPRRPISDARLVLVGSGPLEPRVKAQAEALGIAERVLFLGEQPFPALPDIYAASDVLAVSSDFESFCFAALEAMASGLPIVTTDCGWVPRLIGEKLETGNLKLGPHMERVALLPGGMVVPVRDVEALADALGHLAKNNSLCSQMGSFNRHKAVSEHGWKSSAEKVLGVYKDLMGQAKET